MDSRLKASELKEAKRFLLEAQDWKCALGGCDLRDIPSRDICLDHDHETGLIRAVLCRNCNAMEGKVHNCARRAKRDGTKTQWLTKVLAYWETHSEDTTGVYHPTHRTDEEKRLRRNKRARERRKAKKVK